MDSLTAKIESFLDHRRAANCATSTLSLYRRQLTVWRAWLAERNHSGVIADLVIEDLRGFMAHLRDEYVAYATDSSSRKPSAKPLSDNTRASYHRTLRAFWSFLAIEGLLSAEQQRFFERISAPSVPDDPRPSADADTVQRLLAACGDGSTEESARNRAIVLLLFETGMRIQELCNLTDSVVEPAKRRARVLRAKGGKHRLVFWRPSGGAALARYLLLRRGGHGGPLFRGCSIRNNGGKVTPDLVRVCIKRLAADAGVALPKGAPLHTLRHGFAHTVIDRGGDISDLSQMLGHASIQTTMIYVRSNDTQLESTYRRIFGPHRSAASEDERLG